MGNRRSVSTAAIIDSLVLQTHIYTPIKKKPKKLISLRHQGYIDYLVDAWNNNYGIVIRPQYIYNIILHQIYEIICNDPIMYKNIFVSDNEKKIFDTFIPKFNNTDIAYDAAMKSLLDKIILSFTKHCDRDETRDEHKIYGNTETKTIQSIRIYSDNREWLKLFNTLSNILELFKLHCVLNPYIAKCIDTISDFICNMENKDYWRDFFRFSINNSIEGHITKFFIRPIRNGTNKNNCIIDGIGTTINNYIVPGICSGKLDNYHILIPEY